MAKKRMRRHTKEFRRTAVERLKGCDNIVALARELGVHRRLLYQWRDQAERVDGGGYSPTTGLEEKVRELEHA